MFILKRKQQIYWDTLKVHFEFIWSLLQFLTQTYFNNKHKS